MWVYVQENVLQPIFVINTKNWKEIKYIMILLYNEILLTVIVLSLFP